MLVNRDSSDLGAARADAVAVIRSALVQSFGSDAGRVAEQQLSNGHHEPKMAALWATIADRLRV